MTKTLTEQWKNGELATGWYFYKTKLGGIVVGFQFYGLKYPYNGCHQTIDSVKGVVAPVPSYEEFQRLQEQLKEANEIMKHYANDENWCNYYDDVDENMTKAIYIGCDGTLKASIYLKKWGIK